MVILKPEPETHHTTCVAIEENREIQVYNMKGAWKLSQMRGASPATPNHCAYEQSARLPGANAVARAGLGVPLVPECKGSAPHFETAST